LKKAGVQSISLRGKGGSKVGKAKTVYGVIARYSSVDGSCTGIMQDSITVINTCVKATADDGAGDFSWMLFVSSDGSVVEDRY
jgi:hypothetical protein